MSEQNNVRRQPTVHRNGQRRKVSRVRMKELKRRRRNFLIAMAVAIILVICLIRFLVIQLLPKSDVTTLTVKDNGQIVLEEVIDLSKSGGSESELKSYVKNLVKDFDKDNGRDAVKIRRFSHVKGKMYVETRYKNAKTYSKFTGYTLYTGTVKEAMKSGYDFNDAFIKVESSGKGGALKYGKGDYIDSTKVTKEKSDKVLIIRENIRVRIDGDLRYITDVATKVDSKDAVSIAQEDGNPDASVLTYIVYK